MDIDFFKKVNDSYGYDVGDLVLKEVARLCSKSKRVLDIFGRLGGAGKYQFWDYSLISHQSNLLSKGASVMNYWPPS